MMGLLDLFGPSLGQGCEGCNDGAESLEEPSVETGDPKKTPVAP